MAKAKLKTAAQISVPQSKDAVATDIKSIGDIQRSIIKMEAEMNDAIGNITTQYSEPLNDLKQRLSSLQKGVQSWCESNRAELTLNGKTKTANLITGDVQWRQRPPSVSIRGQEAVLDALRNLGLSRFIRNKEEPNKEAMLNEPEIVRGVAGITIVTGVEDFVITPFEQESGV